MSEARIDRIANENNTGGPTLSGITTFSGQQYFIPPSGSTAERPSDCPPGSIRFNTDSAHLEYFSGLQWLEFEASSEELGGGSAGITTFSTQGTGHRGLFGGGYESPTTVDRIEYITISTLGNSQDFGDLSVSRRRPGSCASSTRGIWGGGAAFPTYHNVIDYVTIASTGDAINFGDLTQDAWSVSSCSSQTRGVFGGRYKAPLNYDIIDYITIASTGDAVDFGDLTRARRESGSCSSSVRGIFAGGRSPVPSGVNNSENIIDYITISSTGNAQDFGDLNGEKTALAGGSNSTRGLFFGGNDDSTPAYNSIEFLTISSTGNAQDFGDLTESKNTIGACTSPTRLVVGGRTNVIEFVTISTLGNAVDFGDLVAVRRELAGLSNGHGGL